MERNSLTSVSADTELTPDDTEDRALFESEGGCGKLPGGFGRFGKRSKASEVLGKLADGNEEGNDAQSSRKTGLEPKRQGPLEFGNAD